MRDLLERWHRLEPERVHIGPPLSDIGADVRLGGVPLWVTFDTPGVYAPAVILAATIEAIEAHKGRFTLKRDIGDSHYFAAVRFQSQKTPRIAKSYQPAAALLLAYLAALEAEAGS